MMNAYRTTVATLALLMVVAVSAEAQERVHHFQVAVGGGWHSFAGGSAVKSGATISGEATYYLTPSLGVGLWTEYTFTETDGGRFPPAALSFVDSTTFTIISQPLDIWQYGAHAKLQMGGSLGPFLLVGAGGYTVFLDPQQVSGSDVSTGFVLRLGVGLDLAVTDRAGFQIAVFDAFFPDWSPNRLYPVRDQFQNTRFPELNPDPDDLDDSVHNLGLTVAITVVPGA